ncbi:hypothetical protein V4C53_33985 [Paraburkholderia azotifigens]|uniref:hypothetical protein n=1 Tax=Paraburkholderia azotifigens TaxID=2057004 RepID=UPI00317D930D
MTYKENSAYPVQQDMRYERELCLSRSKMTGGSAGRYVLRGHPRQRTRRQHGCASAVPRETELEILFGGQHKNVRLALHFALPSRFAGGVQRVGKLGVDQFGVPSGFGQ